MNLELLKEELRRDEGYRDRVYRCTAGRKTIGYGHQSDALGDYERCTLHQAEAWLEEDIREAQSIAEMFCYDPEDLGLWGSLGDTRQRVLVNMAFNLGCNLVRFRQMRKALACRDFMLAAKEMLTSFWARQVGERAERLAQMMRSG
jgi:lysozyme